MRHEMNEQGSTLELARYRLQVAREETDKQIQTAMELINEVEMFLCKKQNE